MALHEKKSTRVIFFYHGSGTFSYGVAQVFLHVLNGLDKSRFEPILVITGSLDEPIANLDSNVRVVELHKRSLKGVFFSFVSCLKECRPEIVISAMEHPNVLAVLAKFVSRLDFKLIITSHNVLTSRLNEMWSKRQARVVRFLIPLMYPRANFFLCVSDAVRKDFLAYIKTPVRNAVIYNPVFPECLLSRAPVAKEKGLLVVSSRLTTHKNVSEAVRALSHLDESYRLIVLGDGSERVKLERLVVDLGLESRVDLLGFVKDPFAYYSKAETLVHPSRWEGFGNILIEAMACGCQIVANSQAGAPSEVLCNGEYGFLYEGGNAESLANNVLKARSEPKDRQSLINYASEFTDVRVARQYERLFDSLLMDT
ncbi:glycosyltransferase [Alcanivorax sp. DP30]|uniref:glycosyltransferase n=1 Tax=Alcanivorax sp. DP30 TaxID=2606217 RepID=UPI00136D8FE1|nr:glycosyltransferase [Alcanivorax sp. DP30]MZR64164.1 glycosyltransferase [Alcanivorax sp. DP30]